MISMRLFDLEILDNILWNRSFQVPNIWLLLQLTSWAIFQRIQFVKIAKKAITRKTGQEIIRPCDFRCRQTLLLGYFFNVKGFSEQCER